MGRDPVLLDLGGDGGVLTFEGQHEHAIAEFEKAVALNPNFTDWWFGMALLRAGEPARAITVIETHMRYDPFCSPLALGQLGLAHYTQKEYSKALPPPRTGVAGPKHETRSRLVGRQSGTARAAR